MTLFPRVVELLAERGADDVLVFGGGIIPREDIVLLKEQGVAEIFTPGTPTQKIVEWLRATLDRPPDRAPPRQPRRRLTHGPVRASGEGAVRQVRGGRAARQGRWSPDEAEAAAAEVGGTVVVKAQVQIGGRGKAGGIQLAKDPAEARQQAERILGMDIRGHTVRRVLVEQASEIAAEYYVAILHDRASKGFLAMASTEGGVEIEQVAAENPEAIVKVAINPLVGLRSYHVNQLVYGAGFDERARKGAAQLLAKLYEVFVAADCMLVEVNPLVLTAGGEVIALDGKVSSTTRRWTATPTWRSCATPPPSTPRSRRPRRRASTTSSSTATSASSATAPAWS